MGLVSCCKDQLDRLDSFYQLKDGLLEPQCLLPVKKFHLDALLESTLLLDHFRAQQKRFLSLHLLTHQSGQLPLLLYQLLLQQKKLRDYPILLDFLYHLAC